MNLKILFVVFLCLLSSPMICDVTMSTVKATEKPTLSRAIDFATNNGTEPEGGDERGGGWPK